MMVKAFHVFTLNLSKNFSLTDYHFLLFFSVFQKIRGVFGKNLCADILKQLIDIVKPEKNDLDCAALAHLHTKAQSTFCGNFARYFD